MEEKITAVDGKNTPEAAPLEEPGQVQAKKLDLDVKDFPTKGESKTLAFASVTLGGCFAIRDIRIMDSEKGIFVAMPDRKDSKGEYRDICFPTTKEMREALHGAVLGEYKRTVEHIASRGEMAMKRSSVRDNLKQKESQVAERPAAPSKKVDRGER